MAAAAITPSVVQRSTEQVQDGITGVPVRITKFKLKATKVTQADWIDTVDALGANYTTDKVVGFKGIVIPTGGDAAAETVTIDDSEDYIIMAGAGVGTAWIEIEFTE
jgi:formylglycine-generating enzyme required for sulfatase activity